VFCGVGFAAWGTRGILALLPGRLDPKTGNGMGKGTRSDG
jgi:hypothetical protein